MRPGAAVLLGLLAVAGCGGQAAPHGRDGGAAEAAVADAPVACEPRDGACDPIGQTGCDAGAKCSFVGADLGCVAGGAGAAGEPCHAIIDGDDCGPGLVCASDGTGDVCFQFCDHTCGAPCHGGFGCNTRLSGTDAWACGALPASCDLLRQDCAGAADACYLIAPAAGTTGCLPAGAAAAGDACTVQNDCGRGLLCIDPTSSGTTVCTPLCDPAGASPCASGTCTALPHLSTVGYCRQ